MPLLNHTPVSPLPLPSLLSQLPGNTHVWTITQTAELFTDYESYANRYLFYSQPIFTPDLPYAQSTHPLPIPFFEALNLEHQRLDHLLRSEFPNSLKPRLLSSLLLPSAQLQLNIDHLVDHLYHLYHNRFDVDERVVVDLALNQSSSPASSRHDARVVRVFPPKPIRDLDKKSYSDLIHLGAIHRFQLDLTKCLQVDDPEAYLYTIQLINKQGSKSDNFGASYMEVETQKLGRHPDSFSKALLKRFLQSVLVPHSETTQATRWAIRPHISLHPDSPNLVPPSPIHVRTHNSLVKNLNPNAAPKPGFSEPELKKRRKNTTQRLASENSLAHPPKLHKNNPHSNPIVTCPQPPHFSNKKQRQLKHKLEPPSLETQSNLPTASIDSGPHKNKKKKMDSAHPITPTPMISRPEHTLPLKSEIPNPPEHSENSQNATTSTSATKESKKTIKYPIEDLDLDPLTVIDGRYLRRANPTPVKLPKKPQPDRQKFSHKFAQKLKIWLFVNIFRLNERRYRFDEFDNCLDDSAACLVKLILRQTGLRYPNTSPNRFTSISVLPFFATRPIQECTAMSIDEREYWVRKGLRFLNIHRRCYELSQSASTHKKKLSRGVLEEDWVMGLVEVMCHRGGIERLGCMARIFKYLFSTNATLLTIDHTSDEDYKLDNSVHPHQKCHSNSNTAQTNPLARTLDFDGDSPLTSNIDENSEDGNGNVSVEGANVVEDEEPESGIETGDEDGRRYGRSIRHQRDHPKQLRKTLASRFTGLPVEDKLTLIDFLCELAMESEQVRNYMEECDEKLTIVRKEKADVNKEKRKVIDELMRLENRKAASTPQVPPLLSSGELTSAQDGEPSPIVDRCKSNTTELPITNPPARPIESSQAVSLESQHSNQSGQDTKIKLTQTKPVSSILSSNKPAPSVDLTSIPHVKTNLRKPESPKQASNRPLETHVRIATLTARQIKQPSYSATKEIEIGKQQLENQLFEIGLKELKLQERFRQLIGVTKLKPLGADRFYCKYWWFDGIGGMEIHSDDDEKKSTRSSENQSHLNEEEIKWYSGCLFVSGPSIEEWDKICESHGGYDQILKRRLREELGCSDNNDLSLDDHQPSTTQLVGVDQWGIYETEDQIEELMTWLNSKGTRENNLKMNLKEWKEYITHGIRCRNKSLSSSAMATTNDHQVKDNNLSTIENQEDSHLLIKSNGFKQMEKSKSLKLENDYCNHTDTDDCSHSSRSSNGTNSLGNIASVATDDSIVNHSNHFDEDGDD